ncbi:MAG: translation initiation factor IF-2 [Deltaproteobacteria bacterium]|nr:translation initiation factor IF-2 [Deltaproteobacteria bacterium]
MGKIRVYELAQKLGMDNKALMEKLTGLGIDVKSHMSVLEEDDLQKIQAGPAPEATGENKYVEKRVSQEIIRRRRKEPAAPPSTEALAPTEPATVPETPVIPTAPAPEILEAEEATVSPETIALSGEEHPSISEPAAASLPEAKPEPPSAPVGEQKGAASEPLPETPPPVKEEPAPPTGPILFTPAKRTSKPSSGTARILGRVDLGRSVEKPKPVISAPVAVPEMPTGEGEAKKAAVKGGRSLPPEVEQQKKAPSKNLRGERKKQKIRVVDIASELEVEEEPTPVQPERREIFEPKRMDRSSRGRRGSRQLLKKTEVTVPKAIKRIIRISDVITVGELAKRMGIKANELIKLLMKQGSMVTINHPLDFDTAAILASEFSYEVENVAFDEESILKHQQIREPEEGEAADNLQLRPPVVTIMGHVDHGKTSLLDAIRTTNVIAQEAGGITQHIGAYQVELKGKKICFLDTPGHEAFTSMRARGAKVTDIVVLVVAADDGVMPQTEEAINHSKAAGVPIIVAINKIDKAEANPDRVKQGLTEFALVPEEWGGETIFVEVSAKKQLNLDELLEMILLQAEVMELKADPAKRAKGTIVEARLDRGRGAVATVLVQEGTLRVGDPVVTGIHYGHVRTMVNDRGDRLLEAGPSTPVEITGLSGVPDAGDNFYCLEDEKAAKEVALHRQQKIREAEMAKTSKISLEQLYARIKEGGVKELNVILKADVQGSVEAVRDSLTKLTTTNCRLSVLHSGVGGITETDVSLASASDAIILGFNVRPETKAAALAEAEGVDIRLYNIIYDAVNDIRDAMEGLLAPTYREKELGRVEIREAFHISKVGTVAGCYVLEGKVQRNAQVRLVRDNVVVWKGKMSSLKRFKDDVREVASGYECGIALDGYNDIKPGDIIEVFEMEVIKTKLGGSV